MDQNPHENIAQTMRDTVAELNAPVRLNDSPSAMFADPVLYSQPHTRTLIDVTDKFRGAAEYLKPARRRGTARLATLESLIDWANRFKGEESVLYADTNATSPSITCISDYHHAGPATIDVQFGDPTARHGYHRGTYSFPVSQEWSDWSGADGVAMEKDAFGAFLEDHLKDLVDPSPYLLTGRGEPAEWERKLREIAIKMDGRFGQILQLIQLSKSLQIYESSNLAITTNRDTGEAAIQFQNEHRDAEGKPLQVPNLFLIAIPVFRGGAAYRLPVRLKYRKSGQTVKFTVAIHDASRAFEDAIGEATETARTRTGLPLFEGTPET